MRQLAVCEQLTGDRNRTVRLLLKAYQALTIKDYEVVRELCKQAGDLDPTLAGPHILTGLSHMQQGHKNQARIAFNKARALDPDDQEIAQLLRMTR